MATVHFSLLGKKKCRFWAKSVQSLWNNGLLNLAFCLSQYIVLCIVPKEFDHISPELRNREQRGCVCSTLLIVSDRLMPMKAIFGEKMVSNI
ncbi:hypothetical protein T01_11367 [Trichinella spiralis]|uniref:Uncharacterized protein n=1 Tax=Trichinella spiralis TaxID=6334 RepID=A0A0V1AYX4_TRISP|nr:hypothetical protein T01_11367 [Trichinella spiralis]